MDVRATIEEALRDLGIETPFVEIEQPRVVEHGDLATPVAMSVARSLRRPPRDIAEEIAERLSSTGLFERVDVAGPGFINLFLKRQYLWNELLRLLKDPAGYLRKDIGKGERVQVEFVSANPTGPLHLGHGRGAAVGAALSALLQRGGYSVEREFYINDAGRQVQLLGESLFARYCEALGREYPIPEEGYRGEYLGDLARSLVDEVSDRYLNRPFQEVQDFFVEYAVQKMLGWIKRDLEDFGVTFDRWQSEKALYQDGTVQRCHEELKKRGFLYEKDGALWFRSTLFGDDKDRVVIKSDGTPTYFSSDIAYHWYKLQRGFHRIINIWGADHHGYVPRIKAVVKALGLPEERLHILLVQMVNLLKGGRPVQMSKRYGEFVTLREVMEEVGADTTKFIFLTRRHDSHLDFDIEVAKASSSENPVYYVQYAHARINSIFRKADQRLLEDLKGADPSLLEQDEEIALLKKLLLYPLIFEGAVRALEPHRITFYLQELASLFHYFYTKHRVLTEDRDITMARLLLCKGVLIVLREGFGILGITAPEKM